MALKSMKGTEAGTPSVKVVIQQPRAEPNPFSGLFGGVKGKGRGVRRNPKELKSNLMLLAGLFGLVFALSKITPRTNIGSLNSRPIEAPTGSSNIASFRIDENNAERVQTIIASFLRTARESAWLQENTRGLLIANSIDLENEEAVAIFLHNFVNNDLGVIPDPEGFERIVSPEDLLFQWIEAANDQGRTQPIHEIVGGDCFTADTRVLVVKATKRTSQIGSRRYYEQVPISEVEVGDQVVSYNFERGVFEPKKVLNVWNKGCRPVVKVSLTNGTSFTSTPDHKMFTGDSHRGRLTPRVERLSTMLEAPNSGLVMAQHIPPMGMTTDRRPMEMFWLDGIYLAEGYGSSDSRRDIDIANDDPVVVEAITEKLTAVGARYRVAGRPVHNYVNVHSGPVATALETLGSRSGAKKMIPSIHFAAARAQLLELLDAYATGDGHIHQGKRGNRKVTYGTISKQLAYDLFLSHLLIGQPASVRFVEDHMGVGRTGIYRVHSTTPTPDHKWDAYKPLFTAGNRQKNLTMIGIEGVEPVSEQTVFDIEVEDNHNFVLADSGLIVHNCDDKTLLLSALYFHAGIPSEIVIVDSDGDGVMDHAGVVATVNGRRVFAETVVPGRPLGWEPDIKGKEVLFIS